MRHNRGAMASTRKSRATRPAAAPADVKEACVAAAHAFIAEQGVERLSLRDVARRLGVSHQAPYKHFASRDDLLAEVIRRCFERFAAHLDARPRREDAAKDLGSLGGAYLEFALANPLEYRLMFGTPWPADADHPALAAEARRSFDILRGVLARRRPARRPERTDLDALLVWSSMHGLASVMQGTLMTQLRLPPGVLAGAVEHIMKGVHAALEAR